MLGCWDRDAWTMRVRGLLFRTLKSKGTGARELGSCPLEQPHLEKGCIEMLSSHARAKTQSEKHRPVWWLWYPNRDGSCCHAMAMIASSATQHHFFDTIMTTAGLSHFKSSCTQAQA